MNNSFELASLSNSLSLGAIITVLKYIQFRHSAQQSKQSNVQTQKEGRKKKKP